jgi:hypothetical protein
MKKIIILCITFFLISSVYAASYTTKQLFQMCDKKSDVGYYICVAYIAGYMDSAGITIDINDNKDSKARDFNFNPDIAGRTYTEVVDLYVAWIRDKRNSFKSYVDKEKFLEQQALFTLAQFAFVKNPIHKY